MAKKQRLVKEWKSLVAQVFNDHPDWKASQIQRQLKVHLGESKAPGLSAVQKELTPMRKRYEDIRASGVDAPWHLGYLVKPEHFPVSAKAIRRIIEVQRLIHSREQEVVLKMELMPLTIRQALWVARLHAVVEKARDLWLISWAYSLYERTCELTGIDDCDTYEYDTALVDGDFERILELLDYHAGTDERFKALVGHYLRSTGDIKEAQ